MNPLVDAALTYVRDNRQTLVKYVGAAIIIVPMGLLMLWIFLRATTWPSGWANFASTMVMLVPNYLLNRYWVWEKNDANRFWGEVVPFIAMALLGVLVSTVAVGTAGAMGAPDLLLLPVNFVSFGVVWVAKFFVFDKFLFGANTRAD